MRAATATAHSSFAALRARDFRLFWLGAFCGTVGFEMQGTAVGWELYERTHSALALGYIGLVTVIPLVALVLPAGHVVDSVNRRIVLIAAQGTMAAASIGLAAVSQFHAPVIAIYGCFFVMGVARAFQSPVRNAILPALVPEDVLPNAVTWNSGGWQLAAVIGPALGGLMIGAFRRPALVYLCGAAGAFVFLVCATLLHYRPIERVRQAPTIQTLIAGARYVWQTKLILAAITLDLFAVLLGGATSLMPIYAKDILHVGPVGLGWMDAAPSIGAVVMAVPLARKPLKHAGRTLLWAVFGFGAATLVFGLSRSFVLSLAMLVLLGGLDMVSVVVRGTLVPLLTPDDMRGRVGAINSLFIGTSNQLGGFESGVVARLFTPVVSVVSGAIGTMIVVAAVAWKWPELRALGPLTTAAPAEPAQVVSVARAAPV
jgi:MFS family permease